MGRTDKKPARRSLADRIREPPETAVERSARAAGPSAHAGAISSSSARGRSPRPRGLWWLLPDDTKQRHLTPALRRPPRLARGAPRGRRRRAASVPEPRADVRRRRRRGALLAGPRACAPTRARRSRRCATTTTGRRPAPATFPAGRSSCRASRPGQTERLTIGDLLAALSAARPGDAALLRRGLERGRVVGRLALRRSPEGVPARRRARAGRSSIGGQPRRRGQPGPVLRLDRPRDRAPSADAARDALTGTAARASTHGAPLRLARADEAGAQEHQGDHVHRLLPAKSRRITGASGDTRSTTGSESMKALIPLGWSFSRRPPWQPISPASPSARRVRAAPES